MKVLLVTSNWTETLGHAVRSIAIAEQLLMQGHQAAFLCPKSYQEWLPPQAEFFESFPKPDFANKNYFGLHTYEDIIFTSGHTEPEQIIQTLEREREVIRQFQPDIIINDEQFTIGISSVLERIPVASIVTWPLHPLFQAHLSSEIPLRTAMLHRMRKSWNQVLHMYGLPAVQHLSQLLFDRSDLLLAPTCSMLEPELSAFEPRVHYVGPLAPKGRFAEVPPWLKAWPAAERDQTTVFIYLSSLPFGMNTVETFELLADSYRGTGFRAVFGIGKFNEAMGEQLTRLAGPNVRFESFVPGEAMMSQSQLAIFPGTHSMMISAAKYGVPSILFPDFFEREYNARCMERAGIGHICRPDEITGERILELSVQLVSRQEQDPLSLQVQSELNSLGGPKQVVSLLQNWVYGRMGASSSPGGV